MLASVAIFKNIISQVSKYSLGALGELPKLKRGSYKFIGLGKSAGPLCECLIDQQGGEGLVFTKKAHGRHHAKLEYYEGGHPHIDEDSFANGRMLYRFLQDLNPDDVLIICLTGGASAVVELPAKGLEKKEVIELNKRLVYSGKDIASMNLLRKEVSLIKNGGILSMASCNNIITYMVSDVPYSGEEMWSAVGSSPTIFSKPDETKLKILKDEFCHDLKSVNEFFIENRDEELRLKKAKGIEGKRIQYREVASYEVMKQFCTLLLPAASIENKPFSGLLDNKLKDWLSELKNKGNGEYISGGEWTVEAPLTGKGGRCTHFVLLAAKLIFEDLILGTTDVEIIGIATDGSDGDTDCAGAWIDYKTYQESQKLELDVSKYLLEFNSYEYFQTMGALIKTGPTQTNIMDLRYIRVFSP
jgi:hydroxypyruvate reductase